MSESTTTPTTTDKDAPTVAESTTEAPKTPVKRKKSKRAIPQGQFHVHATFNNTIVTFTDGKGGSLTSSSAGACGFRGSKKGTAYAAQIATDKAAQSVKQLHGMTKVDVMIRGIGLGREAAVRSLANHNISVESISDVTGIPHGGVRPKKARRV